MENVFTLDSDFNFFTKKKPATISILNVEKSIDSWREFLVEVLKQLYFLDANTFRLAVRDSNVNFKITTEKSKNSKEIYDGMYVDFNLEVQRLLTNVKRMIENFDEIAGTNIKDEIWFTLK